MDACNFQDKEYLEPNPSPYMCTIEVTLPAPFPPST